jgi:hypothetical protein
MVTLYLEPNTAHDVQIMADSLQSVAAAARLLAACFSALVPCIQLALVAYAHHQWWNSGGKELALACYGWVRTHWTGLKGFTSSVGNNSWRLVRSNKSK